MLKVLNNYISEKGVYRQFPKPLDRTVEPHLSIVYIQTNHKYTLSAASASTTSKSKREKSQKCWCQGLEDPAGGATNLGVDVNRENASTQGFHFISPPKECFISFLFGVSLSLGFSRCLWRGEWWQSVWFVKLRSKIISEEKSRTVSPPDASEVHNTHGRWKINEQIQWHPYPGQVNHYENHTTQDNCSKWESERANGNESKVMHKDSRVNKCWSRPVHRRVSGCDTTGFQATTIHTIHTPGVSTLYTLSELKCHLSQH